MSRPSIRALGLAALPRLQVREGGRLAELQSPLGRGGCEEMHGPGNDAGPAGLMAGADTGPVVAMEVLVEQDEIAPMRILLELPGSPVHRSPAVLVPQEDAGQPARDLLGHL